MSASIKIAELNTLYAPIVERLNEAGFTFSYRGPNVVEGYILCRDLIVARKGDVVVYLELTGDFTATVGGKVIHGLYLEGDENGEGAKMLKAVLNERSPEFNAGVAESKKVDTTIRNNPHGSDEPVARLQWAAGWLFGYDGLSGHNGYLTAVVMAHAAYEYSNGWHVVMECASNEQISAMFTLETTEDQAIAIVADSFGL